MIKFKNIKIISISFKERYNKSNIIFNINKINNKKLMN